MMLALTLTQPWATLVAIGAKRIETRSWGTTFRGPLAIHAGKGLSPVGGLNGLVELSTEQPFKRWLDTYRLLPRELPRGSVIATCILADCIQITAGKSQPGNERLLEWFNSHSSGDDERDFGDYHVGRWMWALTDVVTLPEPVPARGTLGLWKWDGCPDKANGERRSE